MCDPSPHGWERLDQSSCSSCRCLFRCPRWRLSVSRRLLEARVGLVAFRTLTGRMTATRSSISFVSAARRLRACVRSRCLTTVRRPSADSLVRSRCRMRALYRLESCAHASKSKRRVTRVLTLLTCCPPGPGDRENCASIHRLSVLMSRAASVIHETDASDGTPMRVAFYRARGLRYQPSSRAASVQRDPSQMRRG